MNIQVNVEQRHIDAGQPGACMNCPVVLAIVEAWKAAGYDGKTVPVVTQDYIIWPDNFVRKTPLEIGNFVVSFDAMEGVEPFQLEVAL